MEQALREARARPGEVVVLFSDEASFYRQPGQAWLWARLGRRQPRLPYAQRANTCMRVVGVLDASSGRVQTWDFNRLTAARLRQCWLQAARQYPDAQNIYLVMDNWPVHFHPTALDALAQDPRLQLIRLPTYAPWLNPIEKLWRLVRQRVTHAHPWSADFAHFQDQVRAHLRAFQQDSPGLLTYVGLVPQ